MSEVRVKVGDRVKITDVIGIEGSTGNSTGSHCHYCVRTGNKKGSHKDISAISGIPNALGVYNDGYVPKAMKTTYLIWKDPFCAGVRPDWQEITGQEFYTLVNSPTAMERYFIKLPSTETETERPITPNTNKENSQPMLAT